MVEVTWTEFWAGASWILILFEFEDEDLYTEFLSEASLSWVLLFKSEVLGAEFWLEASWVLLDEMFVLETVACDVVVLNVFLLDFLSELVEGERVVTSAALLDLFVTS